MKTFRTIKRNPGFLENDPGHQGLTIPSCKEAFAVLARSLL